MMQESTMESREDFPALMDLKNRLGNDSSVKNKPVLQDSNADMLQNKAAKQVPIEGPGGNQAECLQNDCYAGVIQNARSDGEEVMGINMNTLHPTIDKVTSETTCKSFVSLFKDNSPIVHSSAVVFEKFEPAPTNISLEDGTKGVFLSVEEWEGSVKSFRHTLVLKTTSCYPVLANICKIIHGWRLDYMPVVSQVDHRHYYIFCKSEKDLAIAWSRPDRRIGKGFFHLFRWSPSFNTKREATLAAVWVRFPTLALHCYHPTILKCLAGTFGNLLAIDRRTANLTAVSFARICVETDVTKPLPPEIWIGESTNIGFRQRLVFEGNSLYCTVCGIHGHESSTCKVLLKSKGKGSVVKDMETAGLQEKGVETEVDSLGITVTAKKIQSKMVGVAVNDRNGESLQHKSNVLIESLNEKEDVLLMQQSKSVCSVKAVEFSHDGDLIQQTKPSCSDNVLIQQTKHGCSANMEVVDTQQVGSTAEKIPHGSGKTSERVVIHEVQKSMCVPIGAQQKDNLRKEDHEEAVLKIDMRAVQHDVVEELTDVTHLVANPDVVRVETLYDDSSDLNTSSGANKESITEVQQVETEESVVQEVEETLVVDHNVKDFKKKNKKKVDPVEKNVQKLHEGRLRDKEGRFKNQMKERIQTYNSSLTWSE